MRPSHQQSRKFLQRHGWPLGLFSILQTVNYIYEWWEWRHLEDTGSCSRLPHRRRWWLKTCTLVLHPFITQTPNGHRCIKTTGNWQQQMTDEKRGCPCLHISARTFCITVSNFVVSLLCRPEMAHRAQIREHKKKKKLRRIASPSAQKLLSSSLMIRLIIHAVHLRVTWHDMRNDEYRSSSAVSATAGRERQTKKKTILK